MPFRRWLSHGCLAPFVARTRSARLLAAYALCAVLLITGSARADPVEFLRALILHPTDPRVMVLRYESGFGGLLISRDGGHSFAMVPAQATSKYGFRWHIPIQFASDGKLLITQSEGLFVDDGQGCHFSAAGTPLEDAWVVDLARHPSEPDVMFALTMASAAGKHAGLWRRTATELTPMGVSDPVPAPAQRHLVQPTGLSVLPRAASVGGLRFVEAAMIADDGDAAVEAKPALRVSDDEGASWTTHKIPVSADSIGTPRVLAIEGGEPFRALVALQVGLNDDPSSESEPIDPIFLTSDGAATFMPYNAELKMADQSLLLPSGRVLIADRGLGGGLWSATNIGSPLSKIQDYPVHCLGYRAQSDTLFLCKGYEFGVYDLSSDAFCAFFQNRETQALVSCPSQPLANDPNVIRQLCGGWCDALHFASSQVCAGLPPDAGAGCVARSVAYDLNAGHVEAPGGIAAPRCAPPALPAAFVDAGVATDAGADTDSGEDTDRDDQDMEPSGARDGCGCMLAKARTPHGALVLTALLLSAFLYRRRAQRRV